MNPLLVPGVDCFSKLFLSLDKVASVIGAYFFRFSPSCDEPPQSVDEGLCIQGVNDFDMDCSNHKAGKQHTVPFYVASSTADCKRSKAVYSNVGERWFTGRDSVFWKTCHFLLEDRGLSSSAGEAGVDHVAYVSSCFNNPVSLPNQGQGVF